MIRLQISKIVDSKIGSVRFTRGSYKTLQKPIVIDLDKVGFTSLSSDGTGENCHVGSRSEPFI